MLLILRKYKCKFVLVSKNHAKKTYGRVEEKLHSFSTSAPGGGQTDVPAALFPTSTGHIAGKTL
jgi:hypothetical protein